MAGDGGLIARDRLSSPVIARHGRLSSAARLDTWLWAARFFKTRAQAARAIDGGKVKLNGERPKRSRTVGPGDEIRIRKGPYEFHVTVRNVAERRGPAPEAQQLYEETPESLTAREVLAAQLRLKTAPVYEGKGRPTKRDRRAIERLRRDLGQA